MIAPITVTLKTVNATLLHPASAHLSKSTSDRHPPSQSLEITPYSVTRATTNLFRIQIVHRGKLRSMLYRLLLAGGY